MFWYKFDPWRPNSVSDLALIHQAWNTKPLGLFSGFWRQDESCSCFDSCGLDGGSALYQTCSGSSNGCLIRLGARKSGGQVDALSSVLCTDHSRAVFPVWQVTLSCCGCLCHQGGCMSSGFHMNARTQGFPAGHCIVTNSLHHIHFTHLSSLFFHFPFPLLLIVWLIICNFYLSPQFSISFIHCDAEQLILPTILNLSYYYSLLLTVQCCNPDRATRTTSTQKPIGVG